jgi:hypothetical protein
VVALPWALVSLVGKYLWVELAYSRLVLAPVGSWLVNRLLLASKVARDLLPMALVRSMTLELVS